MGEIMACFYFMNRYVDRGQKVSLPDLSQFLEPRNPPLYADFFAVRKGY